MKSCLKKLKKGDVVLYNDCPYTFEKFEYSDLNKYTVYKVWMFDHAGILTWGAYVDSIKKIIKKNEKHSKT